VNAQGIENAARQDIFPRLARHLEGLAAPLEQIGELYRSAGRLLADWIAERYRPGEPLPVVVVCTGNSRRSMLGAMMGNADRRRTTACPKSASSVPGPRRAPSIRGRSPR